MVTEDQQDNEKNRFSRKRVSGLLAVGLVIRQNHVGRILQLATSLKSINATQRLSIDARSMEKNRTLVAAASMLASLLKLGETSD